jgi:acetyl esterase/lipase
VEDCYAGLQWLGAHTDDLGVDPSRIAIGGASAGGGLAAGLALLARDRGEVPLAFQLLIYPMIDDRNVPPASYAITDPRVWHRESNRLGWKAYLGREGGGDDVSPYAAAARATELAGLPATFVSVGAIDGFRDEDVDYATRIWRAGGVAELHVWPGGFHGYSAIAPHAQISQDTLSTRVRWLRRLLAP